MPVSAAFLRFWRALDAVVSDVRDTAWGAVVTSARFPALWDANYARIDAPTRDLFVEDVERELVPALTVAGCGTLHVVSFAPERTTGILAALSSRGHRLGWDAVMELQSIPDPPETRVEELPPGDGLWSAVRDTLQLFGVKPADVLTQLVSLERDVLTPRGKRWFAARDQDGRVVSIAALMVLDGVGYVDNVATLPEARGRGLASAVTAHVAREASAAGASTVSLLADPDAPEVLRLYRRIGFEETGRLASTRGPVGAAPAT